MRITFNSLFSTDEIINSITQFFNQLDIIPDLSQDEDCQLKIVPLHLLPISRNSDERVFSLIPLQERRNFIAIRKDVVSQGDSLGFPFTSDLLVDTEFVDQMLLELKEKLVTEESDTLSILDRLKKGSIETSIVEGCFINNEIKNNYKLIPLNEREFGHYPGQGFLAIVGKTSLSFGTLLRKLNKRDTIISANIERKLKTMVNFKINNHCETDLDGNFHLWVFSEKGSAHVSQSTRNQIEERAVSKLKL